MRRAGLATRGSASPYTAYSVNSRRGRGWWAVAMMLASGAALAACGGAEVASDPRTELAGPFSYRWGNSPVDAAGAPVWAHAATDAAGWSDASTLVAIPTTGGDSLWIRTRVPNHVRPGSTLFVPQVYLTFDAYLNGVRIGGFDEPDAGGKAWHVLELPDGAGGGLLALHVRSTYAKTGLRGRLHVGSRVAHLRALVVEDTPRLILVVLFAIVGLVSAFTATRGTEPRAFGGFAAWSLSLAVWTLFYTRVRELYLPEPAVWVFLWGASLAVMGAGGIVFVQGLFGRGEKILRWAVIANIASSSIGLVLLIARPAASITNLFLTTHRSILGLSYFVVLYVLIRRVREGRRDAVIYLGGLSVHLVLGVRDVLVSVGVLAEHDPVAHWGMLALTIAGGWALLRRLGALRQRVVAYAAALEVNARERELMLRDLHDGLGRITTSIAMLTQVARRDDANPTLQRISDLAHEGTGEIRTFMQGLDEDGCDWDALQAKMRHDASGVLEPLDGSFDLEVKVSPGAGPPSPYLYIQLVRVFQEGITNAIKHATKPRVRANLQVTGIEVVLAVENDGVCADEAPIAPGINAGAGLASMQARATELGGSLEFERDDSVARLCLRVPVPLRYADGAR